jgi:hypothetical protein
MPAAPPGVNAVIATAMLVSMWRAFRGAPASPRRPRQGRAVALVALGVQAFAIAALLARHGSIAAAAAAIGVELTCVSVWLGWDDEHPPEDDAPEDDTTPPGDDTRPLPDWDAFDRERRSWERPRVPV